MVTHNRHFLAHAKFHRNIRATDKKIRLEYNNTNTNTNNNDVKNCQFF